MSPAFALVVSLFLSQSFGLDEVSEPRKSNMISKYLNKTLDSLFEKISGQNINISEVDFGENVGRIYNVVGSISDNLTKKVDGYGSFGFSLNLIMEEIAVRGDYDFVYLDIPGLLPLFGEGPFSIEVAGINLDLLVNAVVNSSEDKFDIKILRFDVIIENSTVKFENIMNDPHVADFLNELLSKLIPNLVPAVIPSLLEISKPVLDYYGNGIIKCVKTNLIQGKIDECIKELFKSWIKTVISEFSNNLRGEWLLSAGNV